MFQTRYKYSKHVVNVSTALPIPEKNNIRQVSATVEIGKKLILIKKKICTFCRDHRQDPLKRLVWL